MADLGGGGGVEMGGGRVSIGWRSVFGCLAVLDFRLMFPKHDNRK